MIPGFAKSLFVQTYGRSPWLSFEKQSANPQWPFLNTLLSQKRISYLHYTLAHHLLRHIKEAEEETALSICHLMLACQEGHLCVQIKEGRLLPAVDKTWLNEDRTPLPTDEAIILEHQIIKGFQSIPESILSVISPNSSVCPQAPICQDQHSFYLHRYWMFEMLFLKHLGQHVHTPLQIQLNQEEIEKTLEKMVVEKTLLIEQSEAILQACLNPITLITGGPGTGKTYTAGYLLKIFWDHLSREQRNTCQIALCAPTGKAAANLQNSLRRVTSSVQDFPKIEAKTLHALLGIKKQVETEEYSQLFADFILVDESSMLDMKMMALLLKSLKPGSRLVLLGDPHQLPSVEAGSVFTDLIESQKHPHGFIPCVSLSICLRAEFKPLVEFSHLIYKGLAQDVLNYFQESSQHHIVKRHFLSSEHKEAQQNILHHILPKYRQLTHTQCHQPKELFTLFQSFCLLSPLRQGACGVETLNQLIWEKISTSLPVRGTIAIPIIITTNDYRQELFNGETGILIRHLPLNKTSNQDYALFPSRKTSGELRQIPALLLPKYEFAYCLSVHKSQGSEFNHVVCLLPEGSEAFGREMFYTAATRARQFLEIFASDATLLKTLARKSARLSGISERLFKVSNP